MTRRGALLSAVAALPLAVAGGVVVASTVLLSLTGMADHPYFASGLRWAWAYPTFAADPGWRASLGWKFAAASVAGLAPLLAAGVGLTKRVREADKQPLHGESHFATRKEAEAGGFVFSREPRPDVITLGKAGSGLAARYVGLPGDSHVALYGMTESGKGVSYVVPNCLAWGGSLVAFDIKGELYRKTAARRAALGQRVVCFSPASHDGRSHRYNPYSIVPRNNPARAIELIHRTNHLLIPPTAKAEGVYWDNSARNAINGIAVILAETPGERLSPGAVRRAALRPDYQEWLRAMIGCARAEGRPYPKTAVDAVLSWIDEPDDRTRAGVKSTISSHLGLWASPTVAAATEESDFDLSAIRKEAMSIFLRLTPAQMRRFRPITAVLFQQLIDLNTEVEFDQDPAHKHKVLMMLDEAWAMGRMDVLADASAFARAFGIRMAYVVQTKAQLVSLYGKEGSENLFENTRAEVVFGVKGVNLSKEVSDMAGQDTVPETTQSRPRLMPWLNMAKQSESETARRRALMLPQEVRRLSPTQQIIFGIRDMKLKTGRVVYYKDRFLAPMEEDPPEVPELGVSIERDIAPASVESTA